MQQIETTEKDAGQRLDAWLASQQPEHSRARWQQLIKEGAVLVNGSPQKPRFTLTGSEHITFSIPEPEVLELIPENIPLDILYEDSDLIVVNKPAGLVVHPAPGHMQGTLVNALLYHCKDLGGIGGELRPGIVHRLDKDTSGALVSAKNETTMQHLVEQFKNREVHKEYLALVWGRPAPARGSIRTMLGRSAGNRKKMSATPKIGRHAISHYVTEKLFKETALLRVTIETGRTHQIRVHMSHLGHPIVGDRHYGHARPGHLPCPVSRQMLHAQNLSFEHPRSHEQIICTASIPEDMRLLLEALSE